MMTTNLLVNSSSYLDWIDSILIVYSTFQWYGIALYVAIFAMTDLFQVYYS